MKQKLSTTIQKIKDLSPKMKMMILGVIGLLLILLVVTIIVAGRSDKTEDTTQTAENNSPYATLLFRTTSLPILTGFQSVPIVLDMGTNSASKISFTIKFDPSSVTNLDLVQKLDETSPLSNSFVTEELKVLPQEGMAMITLKLKDGAVEQIGTGEIAQLSVIVNPAYQGKLGFSIEDVTLTSDKSGTSYTPQTNILSFSK